jgi:hypothetical protein
MTDGSVDDTTCKTKSGICVHMPMSRKAEGGRQVGREHTHAKVWGPLLLRRQTLRMLLMLEVYI